MITHLFYHHEAVEEQSALNSWLSIRNNFSPEDEVIILDLGNNLNGFLPFNNIPKFCRIERIRTDIPQEHSYTYGLNTMIPEARNEWVCFWRSDYVYHKKYYSKMLEGIEKSNLVLPYETFVGAFYCTPIWCKKHFQLLMKGTDQELMKHSTVCPVYELMDFPHFLIKKNLWITMDGMDSRLWGYGPQFPEFFLRLKESNKFYPSIQFRAVAFHQTHKGSFGNMVPNSKKNIELKKRQEKLLEVFKTPEKVENFIKKCKLEPLKPRRVLTAYNLKRPPERTKKVIRIFINLLRRVKNYIVSK